MTVSQVNTSTVNFCTSPVFSTGSLGRSDAQYGCVKRHFMILAVVLACWAGPAWCATLARLSFEDMAAQSTAIVRGKVMDSWPAMTNGLIYTHYKIQVTETFKGTARGSVEIMVPGGTLNGMRQSVSGSPTLDKGDEFVFFLWTSK